MNHKLFSKLATLLLAAALFSGCGQGEAAPPSPEEVSAAAASAADPAGEAASPAAEASAAAEPDAGKHSFIKQGPGVPLQGLCHNSDTSGG